MTKFKKDKVKQLREWFSSKIRKNVQYSDKSVIFFF